ncbi:MAG TPA: polysaccharide deacetylase family protein [Gemmatimonadaceae bacterium]
MRSMLHRPRKARRRATLLTFWDYDTQWGADRSRLPGGPKAWGHLEFENTERVLELHDRYGIPACFAVVGAAALPGERPYHDPAQLRCIHAAGHEIASHAFQHEWIPGLGPRALRTVLRDSKDALEQCIGAAVVSFVPPYNQPFDYVRVGSISLAERREAGRERVDLRTLCELLGETGYRFCRVAYRPLHIRVAERLLGRRVDRPARPVRIAGVMCVRLNAPCGFGAAALAILRRCAAKGGTVALYGHPHSLYGDDDQNACALVPLLERAWQLRREGKLRITLPHRLLSRPG